MDGISLTDSTYLGSYRPNCCRCGKFFDQYEFKSRIALICMPCRRPKPKSLKGTRKDMRGKPLTVRETQIMELIAMGDINRDIAHKLHLSEGTIKIFAGVILAKIGVSNRTAAAVYWITKDKS